MEKEQDSTRKHDRILEIHNRLLSGEGVDKQELADEYGVNPRSIQRDIDSLRDFYSNQAVTKGDVTEIKYDRRTKRFYMISNRKVRLTNAELFAVSKILLESRSLNKNELENIMKGLIESCLPATERGKMEDLIRNERFYYIGPRHGKDLINHIWDLGSAVYYHRKVLLKYRKTNGEITKSLVKPVGIMESEYYFYLIAYVGDKDKKYPGYPTIYRIDRIEEYKITKEFFSIPEKDRFKEGEFRKRIPFMYGGPLTKVKFIYKGPDINAILDRLPTSDITQLEDGNYRIQAEVYGNKGIEMWLGSQKNFIQEERL
ncbi:MAG: WYL domain-containing protein [Lacrimispora sp.]|uniref:helix-turn-helix transcriptional regulator n=1 Tax=Lacrimispora sp. TaxID=2719234 RepID=UPI0039E3DECC